MRFPIPLVFLVFLLSCQPKETAEVGTTAVQPDSLEETVDSANNSRQDGTVTDTGAPEDVKQQLPPELEVLLDQTHGLWQLAQVQDLDQALLTQDQQGPYFLQTDLDADKRTDYVVQVAEGDSVRVYAFLRPKTEEHPWQETILERKRLLTIETAKRSPFYLSLLEERLDTTVSRHTSGKKREGILVNEGSKATWHQWQKGKWIKTVLPAPN